MTLTCYHALVAQKSYGSEKRFLCPPPIVALRQPQQQYAINMSVLADGNEQGVEHNITLDETTNQGSFKSLHVTTASKTKQFCLRVNISQPSCPPFVTCLSSPISIISKPSKKTAKTRHDSTGILTTSQISLYSRINSQTVRTKYLTSTSTTDQYSLCAKYSSWSAFDIILVHQHQQQQLSMAYYNHQQYNHNHQLSMSMAGVPLNYGSEIILKDSQTGACSPRVIIRKVEKGSISMESMGPVCQMQKVALQLASSSHKPIYLSSNGPAIQDHEDETSTWLDQGFSQLINTMDDCFCWTIVGIAKFECTMEEPAMITTLPYPSPPPCSPSHRPQDILPRLLQPSPPPSPPRTIMPLPSIASMRYDRDRHVLHLVGHHLSHFHEFWLGGAHGPLCSLQQQQQQQGGDLILTLPHIQDLVIHHDLLVKTPQGGHSVVFPLLMIRKNHVVYPTGRSIRCLVKSDGETLWTVVS
ncbi:beta-trefoil DNA-binding domain-containing protein [Chlamydoabsidia padenii]|nr:beta-trefoil DNA-binding domain-containing protein [Chlamydoabsidia padenii]